MGHVAIVVYGAVCLFAGCVALFRAGGFLGLLIAPLFLMSPEIVLAWLAGPIAFGLGHWIGDRVTKRRKGHVVARMLSRNGQWVHGTAIVLGTCGYFPLLMLTRQVEEASGVQPLLMLGLVLFTLALSASAHTARRRGRPLFAASFAAVTYAAVGVLIGVFGGAMWMGAFALPFVVYFTGTAIGLICEPKWHDA